MNFIGKHLNLIGLLLLTAFVGTAAGLYYDVPSRLQNSARIERASQPHTCSMHADRVSAKPDGGHQCGMAHASAGQGHACGMASASPSQAQGGGTGGQGHGCCADNQAAKSAMALKLPPGHPPIPGWTTNGTPESDPAQTHPPEHSSHDESIINAPAQRR